MPKWTIEDDCLAPFGKIKIEFRGKNPYALCQKTKSILQRIFEIESKDYWEKDFRWDMSSDPRTFYIRIYVNKGVDFRSKIFAEVIFQGSQPSDPNKEGAMVIFIGAKLMTEYNLKTRFQQLPFYRGLLKLYNFMFYNNVRRGYLNICNEWLERVNKDFRLALNLPNPK
jgi:hypothetical protein